MTKHPYAVWALQRLVDSFERNAPRYNDMPGFVEKRIEQIESAIKVLEADKVHPPVKEGIPLKDLPTWKAGQAAKKQ